MRDQCPRMPRQVRICARMAVSAIVRQPEGQRPAEGTRKARVREWRERLYFHLPRAEWNARVQLGMSLWHPERLAYNLEGPLLALDRSERGRNAGQWDELEDRIWPDGSWTAVIEEFWRENEKRRGQ